MYFFFYVAGIVLIVLLFLASIGLWVWSIASDPVKALRGEPKFKETDSIRDKFGDYESER